MRVIKRNGGYENISFDKVLKRMAALSQGLSFDPSEIAQKVCARIYDGVHTTELDELAAQLCFSMSSDHPDFGTLARRIIISNMQKNTSPSFSETMTKLYMNPESPVISQELYETVLENQAKLNNYIDYSRDFNIDYFGYKTLEYSYLLKVGKTVVERPQHMFMRVALGIHGRDIKDALETYDYMSKKFFVHATPTLFNAGTPLPQCSSCFLLGVPADSVSGIYDALKKCALISKLSGGIGLHVSNVRSKGSRIRGTNGISSGIIPMMRVFNDTARYINQGGKRNGSFCIYLEPWHADVESFIDLRKNNGNEHERARDLFLALWIPDLFMQRVKENGQWSLMCPDQCQGLNDCYGEDFNKLYTGYEASGKFRKQIPAQKLWNDILKAQIETGNPFMLYKDAANRKSNQNNLGTIKSSNLCVAPETMILTDKGYFPIQSLADQVVNVWNGEEFSETTVYQTGSMKPLITVSCDNGVELRCTPYHKFYVIDDDEEMVQIDAKDLQLNMQLVQFNLPTLNLPATENRLKYPYTQGLFASDSDKMHIDSLYLYGDKRSLLKQVEWKYFSTNDLLDRIEVVLNHDMNSKYYVPINEALSTKLKWLEGLVDGTGFLFQNNIQVPGEKGFLTKVKYLLQTIGIDIAIKTPVSYKFAEFHLNPMQINRLLALGFSPKYVKISRATAANESSSTSIRITGIVNKGDLDDTYCFNEPLKHSGIFNGILTGQCTEIVQYSDDKEAAVCNLASIALPSYIITDEEGRKAFDFATLHKVSGIITKNLNKVIDRNFYPTDETRYSNMKHRPIGIGIQGLADTFAILKMPFDSVEAAKLNKDIFETMYHGALSSSIAIAKKRSEWIAEMQALGPDDPRAMDIMARLHLTSEELELPAPYRGAYSSFVGSLAHRGLLQFDMWPNVEHSGLWDWTALKADLKSYGMRNSLLLAPMPTASTSQILSFNECFEPFTSNMYQRRTLAGEFIVVNKYLVNDLLELGLWSQDVKNKIIVGGGSIQNIVEIPSDIKALYKTVWEIKQKVLIDLAADRGAYVCQSQSLNLFQEDPDIQKLTAMHFYGWNRGLKTGMYYLRTRPKAKAQQFSIDPITAAAAQASLTSNVGPSCSRDNPDCIACSS